MGHGGRSLVRGECWWDHTHVTRAQARNSRPCARTPAESYFGGSGPGPSPQPYQSFSIGISGWTRDPPVGNVVLCEWGSQYFINGHGGRSRVRGECWWGHTRVTRAQANNTGSCAGIPAFCVKCIRVVCCAAPLCFAQAEEISQSRSILVADFA